MKKIEYPTIGNNYRDMLNYERQISFAGNKKAVIKKNYYDMDELKKKMGKRTVNGKKGLKISKKKLRQKESDILTGELGLLVEPYKYKNKYLRFLNKLFGKAHLKIWWRFPRI